MASSLHYSELPLRAQVAIAETMPDHDQIGERMIHFEHVQPRAEDRDGATEIIRRVEFTHHFVRAPGDYETIRWHYVTCGPADGKVIVFLHGVPDSWFQWHPQMVALSSQYLCVGVDLKGYGQSDKTPGNYTHEACAEQLYTMLQQVGFNQFFLATHDRGSVQGDFIVAKHPESVLGYARGEQHLYHFNPILAPQEKIFRDAPWTGVMSDQKYFVLFVYTWITKLPIPDDVMARVIQEFWYEGVANAVPRYFNSSTFRQEWIARRTSLLEKWKCPVVIMQGYDSKTQPREFYENARDYIPNAKAVEVKYMKGGHFWTLEDPETTTDAIWHLLEMATR